MSISLYREFTEKEEQAVLNFLKSDRSKKYIEEYYQVKEKVNVKALIKNKAKGKFYSKNKYNNLIMHTYAILSLEDLDDRIDELMRRTEGLTKPWMMS